MQKEKIDFFNLETTTSPLKHWISRKHSLVNIIFYSRIYICIPEQVSFIDANSSPIEFIARNLALYNS